MKKDRREEGQGGGSLRGTIHDPYATPRKGSLFWFWALRDFWISASLVTREPKTVGQVASRRNENERANSEREGISYPSRARTLWSSVQPLNGERSLRLRQKKIVQDDISCSPPFLFPTPPLPILLSSSRDANFFQNDGTPLLPDYQKIPAVFSLEIFGSRHRSPLLSPS